MCRWKGSNIERWNALPGDVQIESYAFSRIEDALRATGAGVPVEDVTRGHASNTCRLIRKAVRLANNERDIAFQDDLPTMDRDSHTLNCQRHRENVFHL